MMRSRWGAYPTSAGAVTAHESENGFQFVADGLAPELKPAADLLREGVGLEAELLRGVLMRAFLEDYGDQGSPVDLRNALEAPHDPVAHVAQGGDGGRAVVRGNRGQRQLARSYVGEGNGFLTTAIHHPRTLLHLPSHVLAKMVVEAVAEAVFEIGDGFADSKPGVVQDFERIDPISKFGSEEPGGFDEQTSLVTGRKSGPSVFSAGIPLQVADPDGRGPLPVGRGTGSTFGGWLVCAHGPMILQGGALPREWADSSGPGNRALVG